MKINLVIADNDEMYLNRFAGYLQEKGNGLAVSAFSSVVSLGKHLAKNSGRVDLILFSRAMLCDELINFSAVKMLMAEDDRITDMGFDCVNKYQKADGFLNQVLLYYAEKSGRSDAVIKGNKDSVVAAFFSPVGGGGKTTLALAVTAAAAQKGKKSLYLNLERINSVRSLLANNTNKDISDVFLALKSKEGNIGLKIMEAKHTDPISKISYIPPSRSTLEINEVTNEELCRLITETDNMGEFDIIAVDMDGEADADKLALLEKCDVIVMPFTSDYPSVAKIKTLADEIELQGEDLEWLEKKLIFVLNKSSEYAPVENIGVSYVDIGYSSALASIEMLLKSSSAPSSVMQLESLINEKIGG